MSTDRDEQGGRSGAEWAAFAVASVVLAVVVGLVALQPAQSDDPAQPVAALSGPVEETATGFQVPVEVTNDGGATAADVQVTASLTIDGETTEADQVIDFLAADDTEDLVFVFADDPADGELVVEVGGFSTP
jgi:uncharacterized protein (TIGR02588 family)